MHAAFFVNALTLAALGAELATFPPEHVCKSNYEIAYKVHDKIVSQIEIFGASSNSRLAECRDHYQWHKDFWWACWWVTWPQSTFEQRLEWLSRVRELRERGSQ